MTPSSPITEPGLYQIPADAYHADPCPEASLSSSGARYLLATCPAKFRHKYIDRAGKERSAALDFGRAAHAMAFEREAFDRMFHVLSVDDLRTKAAREERDEAVAAGRTVIKPAEMEALHGMSAALSASRAARAAFARGKSEQTLVWRDDEFGIWCRARLDWLPERRLLISDYKTTIDASEDAFQRAQWTYGYHCQADWYLAGCEAVFGERPQGFVFVVQEKEPPYLVEAYEPDETAMHWAAVQNRQARARFAMCLRSGRWPGYHDDVVRVGLPPWALRHLENADLTVRPEEQENAA